MVCQDSVSPAHTDLPTSQTHQGSMAAIELGTDYLLSGMFGGILRMTHFRKLVTCSRPVFHVQKKTEMIQPQICPSRNGRN